ncbi:hypothetical protein C9397_08530 [Xanthomonas vasicola pv. vasculorum]|uniref:Uncharacterized protein n=1 Tax=Xanthomonas vasicola pv. vasculorum TaxID=325776 RepID=A0AAE8FBV0_XANVA|nr:hypothetical protein C7V42_19170 [Xanthomonas vasicola pv. vasculorum]AZR28303.1 hypothetical protein NX80_019670 [Xanthomonas vasicola pv. arecae]AZR36270.1 hypothetical protein NX08_019385 [Xanthomonas vasicola]AZM73448.1 hypothetical protein CXP37_19185 [Xanthomonas vasicola pv. vasculorum]OWF58726.1 hypothetical protein B1H41_18090 [Xanthomonas vasicola pv. vasculorum]
MEALDCASAKRHGRGRSPSRECRNAKECKVCSGTHTSPRAGAVLVKRWFSSLAGVHRCQDISRG